MIGVVSGSSSGARTRCCSRCATDSGGYARAQRGKFAAERLPENYKQSTRAAAGGMAAVCATEQYQERITANAKNKADFDGDGPEGRRQDEALVRAV